MQFGWIWQLCELSRVSKAIWMVIVENVAENGLDTKG